MGIIGSIKNLFTVRYTDGSWWIGNGKNATTNTSEYMDLYRCIYPLNAVINITAEYASKFNWGVQKKDGTIDYEHPSLDIIKNPNPYQTTEDLIKQHIIFKSVYGWNHQKAYGAKGYEPSAIYNLNPANIKFIENIKKPLLLWKSNDKNTLKDNYYQYDDNGNLKDVYFNEIMPFYDICNGVGTDLKSMYTSPSRIESIRTVLENIRLALNGINIVEQTAGREILHAIGVESNSPESFINGFKSITKNERQDVDSKLNNKAYLNSKRLRSFTPSQPIDHKDLSLKLKDFGYIEHLDKFESIVARTFNVPLELYQSYKNGATFENQQTAIVKMIDDIQETEMNDIARTWTYQFGNPEEPFVANADHLRVLRNEEDKKADKALKITQALKNLNDIGQTDGLKFLADLGIDFNSK